MNKKMLTKERTNLSLETLNGLRATEDAVRDMGGLEQVEVSKDMLSSVKIAKKAYNEHLQLEKKEAKKRQATSEAEVAKKKRKKEEDIQKVEKLQRELAELEPREDRAKQLLQSASKFMVEGKRKMEKGLAENDMDDIQAAQKLIELSEEKQKKAQAEFDIVSSEKTKITKMLGEKALQKLGAK